MKTVVLVVALLVVACEPGEPTATQVISLPPTRILPVERWVSAQPQGAGFLDVVTGQFTADPTAELVWAGGSVWKTAGQPYLFGSSGSQFAKVAYDAAVKRWVPVARAQIAPDGLSYAYSEWLYPSLSRDQCPHGCMPEPVGGRIHVADPRTGEDRIVYSFSRWPMYQVLRFSKNGIYLDSECNGDYPGCSQLWLLDLHTAKLKRVTDQTGQQWRIHGQYVWVETVDFKQLRRVDLVSGRAETWLSADPSASMQLIGVDDSGAPWVAVGSNALLRVFAPRKTEQILSANGPFSDAVVTHDGTWFAVVDSLSPAPGLYLHTKRGLRNISRLPLLPV